MAGALKKNSEAGLSPPGNNRGQRSRLYTSEMIAKHLTTLHSKLTLYIKQPTLTCASREPNAK